MKFKLNEKGRRLFKLFVSEYNSDKDIDLTEFENKITPEEYLRNKIEYRVYKYCQSGHSHSPMPGSIARQLFRDPDEDRHVLVLTRNEVDIVD